MTENQIIQGIKERDNTVVQYAVQQYFPMIRKMVGGLGKGNLQDAEDVFMEGMEVVYLRLQQDDFTLTCAFSTFLYRVCRFKWINQIHRKKIHQNRVQDLAETQLIEEESELHEVLATQERFGLLREYFKILDQPCRDLLELFLQELPLKTIMQQLGFSSEAYLRKRKFLCKQRLVDMIRNDVRFKELIEK
jgi:RNA polymerase sigma factor (sigma-70 family)